MTPSDRITLNNLLRERKRRALEYGRYPAPYTAHRYDIRKTLGKPFKCIGYGRLVRQINALERLLNADNCQRLVMSCK
jgi:hypothetical protein